MSKFGKSRWADSEFSQGSLPTSPVWSKWIEHHSDSTSTNLENLLEIPQQY